MIDNTKIEQLLAQYKVETEIEVLSKIFFDYGIRDYFNKACEYFNIITFYGSFEAFSAIKREDIVRVNDLDFYKACKYTALVFEGAVYNKLSYKDIQVALIYALFKTLSFKTFIDEIHFSIKDNKKLNEQQIDELNWILPKDTFKNSCDMYAVFMDAKEMFVYWCLYLDTEITSKINNHHKKMSSISNEVCIDYIFTQIKKTSWKTRWGKMKSFNRNFYTLVENLRKQTLQHVLVEDYH